MAEMKRLGENPPPAAGSAGSINTAAGRAEEKAGSIGRCGDDTASAVH
jgi:hypothetical protein